MTKTSVWKHNLAILNLRRYFDANINISALFPQAGPVSIIQTVQGYLRILISI